MANKSETYSIHRPLKEIVNLRSFITVNFLSFLLARAFILKGIMPFGVAFFGASILSGYPLLSVTLSTIAGRISVEGLIFPGKYLSVLALMFFITRIVLRKKRLNRHVLSFITFISVFLVSVGLLYLEGGHTVYDIFMVTFEAFSAGVLVYIFGYAMPVLMDFDKRKLLSREELICLAITFAVATSGIGDVRVWGISIGAVVMAVLILVSAYTGGATVGSAVGVVFGVVAGLATNAAPAVVGIYAFAGLLAGTFKELGRIGSVLGFIIGSAILNFYVTTSTGMVISMEELLAASFGFLVIPGKILNRLSSYASVENIKLRNRMAYSMRARELTSIRLKEFSKVFKQLASTFGSISLRENFGDNSSINRLFDGIYARVCKGCSFYRSCWGKDFYTTYKSVFELISQVEEEGQIGFEDMPDYLKKRCIKSSALIETVNYLYDMHRINYKWQLKMEECSQLVSQQLDNVSKVIENLDSEINIDLKFNEDLEETIYVELDKEGIDVSQVIVVEKPKSRLEIYIEKKSCYGCRECIKKIVPMITNVTGKRFEKRNYVCNIRNNICLLKLVEAQKYQISTGILTRAKAEHQVNGDNYTFMELKDCKYLMALSDGMGAGAKAAMESGVTINLLEQLLDAGFDHELAVKTINSLLVLKSPEDNFSTLDITLVDLYTGDAKIVKIGAPPTFVKRGDEVRIISSSSLPVGIVNQLDFHVKKFSVKSGDFIVMVTDGVLDACEQEDKNRWIADILKDAKTKNPQEVARIIFERALECYGGEAGDDMTVLVAKVWEKG